MDKEIKTVLAVHNACNVMGLNFKKALTTISMYADRNSLVHSSVIHLADSGRWEELRTILARDLVDIPTVTPGHLRQNIPVLQETIQTVVDHYFDRKARNPNDPIGWVPKTQAYLDAAKKDKEQKARESRVLAERTRIAKEAAERCKKLIEKQSMVHLTAASLGEDPPDGALPTRSALKRLRTEEDMEKSNKRFKQQTNAWNKLVAQHQQCHRGYKAYCNKYGNAEAPIDPTVWWGLEKKDFSRSAATI